MPKTPETIAALNQEAAAAAMKLTRLTLEQGEHLMKLHLAAMRGMLDDQMAAAKTLFETRDPQQWNALREQNLRAALDRMTEYSHSVRELVSKTQGEIGGVMEDRLHEMNCNCQALVDEMAKSAPPGMEPAMAVMRQTLAAANAMAETLSKTTHQFAQSAESALKAATTAAVNAGKGDRRKS